MALVVGVRCSFTGEDAGSVQIHRYGRDCVTGADAGGEQRAPGTQRQFRQTLLASRRVVVLHAGRAPRGGAPRPPRRAGAKTPGLPRSRPASVAARVGTCDRPRDAQARPAKGQSELPRRRETHAGGPSALPVSSCSCDVGVHLHHLRERDGFQEEPRRNRTLAPSEKCGQTALIVAA